MRVLMVKGFMISAEDAEPTEKAMEQMLGCAKGCADPEPLRDGAVMYTDREADQRKDSAYNSFASLIAGRRVYGHAVITGANFTDVPDSFLPMMNWSI
jgi:hypothetical protein